MRSDALVSARLHRRMPAIDAVLRADIRRRWRQWLLVAAVGGCLLGVVMACAAGARRTSGAFDGYASAVNAADLFVGVEDDARAVAERASRIDGVSDVGLVTGVGAQFVVRDGRVVTMPRDTTVITADGAFLEGIDRMRAAEGRLPRPGSPEGLASELWLEQIDFVVGETGTFRFPDPNARFGKGREGFGRILKNLNDDPRFGWAYDITIVGRGVAIDDVARDAAARPARLVVGSKTAAQMIMVPVTEIFADGAEVAIRFSDRDGVRTADAEAALQNLPFDWSGGERFSESRESVSNATEPYVRALWISAALTAMIGLGIFGGALARQAVSDAADDGRLCSLGADPVTL